MATDCIGWFKDENVRRAMMTVSASLAVFAASAVWCDTANFDRDAEAGTPKVWSCEVTGRGTPKWLVERDQSAPSAPHVLKQSGTGTFPWCVMQGNSIADGFVEVKFGIPALCTRAATMPVNERSDWPEISTVSIRTSGAAFAGRLTKK